MCYTQFRMSQVGNSNLFSKHSDQQDESKEDWDSEEDE